MTPLFLIYNIFLFCNKRKTASQRPFWWKHVLSQLCLHSVCHIIWEAWLLRLWLCSVSPTAASHVEVGGLQRVWLDCPGTPNRPQTQNHNWAVWSQWNGNNMKFSVLVLIYFEEQRVGRQLFLNEACILLWGDHNTQHSNYTKHTGDATHKQQVPHVYSIESMYSTWAFIPCQMFACFFHIYTNQTINVEICTMHSWDFCVCITVIAHNTQLFVGLQKLDSHFIV